MPLDRLLQPAALIMASIGTGTVAWSGNVLLIPVALVFPVLWFLARHRSVAALVSTGYFLSASRGLPQGVASFYASDLWPGLLLWLVASTSFVVIHIVLWTNRLAICSHRYFVAAAVMALPPFGVTGWAHPATAAGVLFPGWGWWGLVAITGVLMGLATRKWPMLAVIVAGFWIWSAATWTDPRPPDGWQGVDLHMGSSLGRNDGFRWHRNLIAQVEDRASGTKAIVLPESALGLWTPTVEKLWIRSLQDKDLLVIAGAATIDADGYDNVLIALSAEGSSVLYRERMPVPGSMWQPWRSWLGESGGARAYFFANPVATVGDRELAPLICYELLVVWPALQSMLYDPDLVLAVGNGWWTKHTSIVAIQRANARAWAMLFAKPLVLSFNT